MGMFDEILCDIELPQRQGVTYQTKDLACTLAQYKITDEGNLHKRVIRPSGKSYVHDSIWVEVEPPYYGTINFYDYYKTPVGKHHWLEYQAKFSDGLCTDITLVRDEPT